MGTKDDEDDLHYSIEIDWCRCDLLESVPVSDVWVVKGTRMPAQTVIDHYDLLLGAVRDRRNVRDRPADRGSDRR